MASKRSLPEEDLTCPVCCDIFRDPVIQQCSHSICKECLHRFWDIKKSRECPVCRRKSPNGELPRNLALKNLCEAVLLVKGSGTSQGLCTLHGESFKLFCLDDKEPVCVVCQTSRKHKLHDFCPIDEAALDHKEELSNALSPLQEKLKLLEDVKYTYDQTAQLIKGQTLLTERHIKLEFEKLHKFLRDEEKARMECLKAEERQKSTAVMKKIEAIGREISSVSETIQAIQKELKQDNVTFVQNFKATMEKTKCTWKTPDMTSDALIDVAKHMGNVSFHIWKKMQEIVEFAPVILDPNTAAPHLLMSADLTSLMYSDVMELVPDNPERFDFYHCVLGSEGFDSGTHHWDIEVGDNSLWYLGVMTESTHRKGKAIWNGVLSLWHMFGEYKSQSPEQAPMPLLVSQRIQKVRVELDWDGGLVSFFDLVSETYLLTMAHTFTEKVFPFFYNFCVLAPLRILPLKPSVTVG
ncbi:nuclear factor 7, brain-like [Alosa sapidissima]|uniref:nuclear factor 7, brain-like n=1 Tax=Alosa sapidissima TaxID=34773 RepID=UPI001C0A6306|nr:nuclear factor 7, brain-like [Alosa sapidissima]